MEQHLLSQVSVTIDRNTSLSSNSTDAVIALISNPCTSGPTLNSVLEILVLHLQNPKSDHQTILSLLSSLSTYQPNLRRRVAAAALEFIRLPWLPTPLIPQVLSLLDPAESSEIDPFSDESLFLSLCFCPSVKTRSWILRNMSKFHIRKSLFLAVVLGFTKDPYPYIRKAALDGLVTLSNELIVKDRSLIQGGYFRAVELLFDADNSVRCSAVRAVGGLGRLIFSLNPEECKKDWSDALFVQLCLMVRDMEMEIRLAAFGELERIQTVTSDILLQTLSKKCLAAIKDKTFQGQYSAKLLKLPASTAAYIFVHGLEDEFSEVRKSACHAMQMLSILSAEFAVRAVDVLMDMLNDDSVAVRLQCLETLRHIYSNNHFKMEETHLEMLCVTLIDNNNLIRSAIREVLRLSKLRNLEMFKTCINNFVENLELYPSDEADVFNTLYKMGRAHGRFVAIIIQKFSDELEPCYDGKLGFNKARTVALLVLAISAPVSFERKLSSIPPQFFSYAVTLLDRISNGLHDVADMTSILTSLCHCSKFTLASASENFGSEAVPFPLEDSSRTQIKTASSTELILQNVTACWPFLKHGLIDEVLRTLRSFKEELRSSAHEPHKSAGFLFTLNLLSVIKLLAMASRWHFSRNTLDFKPAGILHALSKAEIQLEQMVHRFLGLRSAENLHLVELMLVTCVLRLCYGGNCSTSVQKLKSLLHQAEHFSDEGSLDFPEFVTKLQNISCDINDEEDVFVGKAELLRDSLALFSLKPFILPEELAHLKADIEVVENDFHHPLPFVPSLPVGIPLKISLYNIVSGTRLWVAASIGTRRTQFTSLDLDDFHGSSTEGRKHCAFVVAPFYGAPNVKRLSLMVSIAMEGSSSEPPQHMKNCYHCFGPKRKQQFVSLCKETVVYLSNQLRE